VRASVWEVVLDWLAVGPKPETSHFMIESQMVLPRGFDVLAWPSVAFFTYPVMQAANILLPRAHLAPDRPQGRRGGGDEQGASDVHGPHPDGEPRTRITSKATRCSCTTTPSTRMSTR
jgi:hypothetical protein